MIVYTVYVCVFESEAERKELWGNGERVKRSAVSKSE